MKASLIRAMALIAIIAQSSGAQLALGTPGLVLGITVSPNKVAVFTPTTVILSGSGECGTVLISFGDGRDTTLVSVKFSREVMHSYTKSGTFVVSARAGQNCNASSPVTATATVEGSALDALCALTGCENPTARTIACAQPTIKSVSFVTPLEPKEELVIYGCAFGDASTRGGQRVNIKGAFPSAGTSIGLEVLSWTATAIKAKMPPMSGVRDQTAWLQVANEIHSSNQWGVPFRATRAIQYLGNNAVVIQCADLVYFDKCYGRPTLGAYHANLGGPSTVVGTDIYTVTLANGWVIDGWQPGGGAGWYQISYPELLALDIASVPSTYDFSGLALGAPSGVVRVTWKTGPNADAQYGGWVRAKGPLGVPYK